MFVHLVDGLQVITAVAAIEFSTRYSKACCQLMVDSEGIKALLEFMRSCNRSKPHMEMLGHALACLANICRSACSRAVHVAPVLSLSQAKHAAEVASALELDYVPSLRAAALITSAQLERYVTAEILQQASL